MAKKFITVEAGDHVTKVCVAVGTEKSRKMKQAFAYETPVNSVEDGIVIDNATFASALSRNLQANNCADVEEVYFTVASSKVAIREVQMPLMSNIKIEAIVESNKTDYFPMDLTRYIVLFRVMSRVKKGAEKGCNVMVMAMPSTVTEACVAVAQNANLTLKGVDAACSSMVDGVVLLKQSKVTAYVNVQATSTNMCFMRGSELLLQRTLSHGGHNLVEAYLEEVGDSIDYLEAIDDLSNVYAEENIRGMLTEEDVGDQLDRSVSAIARSMDFFITNKGLEISQMVLMGTCGNIIGMQEMLEQATGIQSVQMSHLPSAMPMRKFSTSAAYFVSGIEAGAAGINFAKDDTGKKQRGDRAMQGNTEISPTMAALIFFLLLVGAGYWAYVAISAHTEATTKLSSLNSQITSMEHLDSTFVIYENFENSKNTLLEFATMTENPNENLIEFLAELEAKMPEEILIFNATCTGVMVSMNLSVSNLVEAATVIAKLRTFDSIEVFSISEIALIENEIGEDSAQFSLVCTYGSNPYTSNLNPYRWDIGIGDDVFDPALAVPRPESAASSAPVS